MHPSAEITREYVCRIPGEVSDAQLQQLARGVTLEDGPARFDEIERIGASDSHAWFRVVLHEGRNREVRRMWEVVGFQVSRLKRVRYGSIGLPRLLRRGQYEELPAEQIERLRSEAGLGDEQPTLTLQPVIGQRRAKTSEYRPEPREQRAWTQGSYGDDAAREVRAFDNLREERPGKPRYGKPGGAATGRGPAGRGGPKKGGGGKRPVPDDIGNRLTAPGGNVRRKPKGAAPGFENPAEHRSWYVPEGVTTTSKIAPPRHVGRPGPSNPRPTRGNGKPGAAGHEASPYGAVNKGPGGNRGSAARGKGPATGKGRGGPAPRGNARGPGHGAPRSNKPRG